MRIRFCFRGQSLWVYLQLLATPGVCEGNFLDIELSCFNLLDYLICFHLSRNRESETFPSLFNVRHLNADGDKLFRVGSTK